jgi:dTDP-4-amino-4,6-dideoxygalactose transaminase
MDATPFIDLKKQFEALRPKMEKAILAVLEGAKYIGGPEIAKLEKALAEYVGVAEVVACGNGTDALTLALLAYGVGPGDAVFCPSFTFIATAEVAALRGATPVFVDIEPKTFNISPADLAHKIELVVKEGSLKPRVVIPVDLFGLPADYPALDLIAKKYDLLVLEDAAQGFGGELAGRRAGSFSTVAATSFFPAKPLGCYGDGGAVMTSDKDLAKILRSLSGHGAGASKYEHERVGMNSRLDSVQAAILLEKLAVFPEELIARQKVAAQYSEILKDVAAVPFVPKGALSSWAQYTIRVPAQKRDGLIQSLKQAGVPTAVYYPIGLHRQKAFLSLKAFGDCPETDRAALEVLSLPMHPYLDEATIREISGLVVKGLE